MGVDLEQITLAQLRFVCAVAQEGTFRGAARKCHVSQPTLSVQIQKLEEALKTTVFDRQWQPVQLTSDGLEIVAQAKVVLFDVEKFASRRESVAASLEGDLRLGIVPTLAPYFVARLATEFVRTYPSINLTLQERPQVQVESENLETLKLLVNASARYAATMKECVVPHV